VTGGGEVISGLIPYHAEKIRINNSGVEQDKAESTVG
jgi:hypothetical protein